MKHGSFGVVQPLAPAMILGFGHRVCRRITRDLDANFRLKLLLSQVCPVRHNAADEIDIILLAIVERLDDGTEQE